MHAILLMPECDQSEKSTLKSQLWGHFYSLYTIHNIIFIAKRSYL